MIFITGANGFIGQHLVPLLVKHFPSENIICGVGPSRKKHEIVGINVLEKLPVKIVAMDLLKKNTLKKLPKSPEIVIHLASAVDTSKSDFRANDIGTENLLHAVSKLNKKSRVIYTSTVAVWSGRRKYQPIVESVPPVSNNKYGSTKLKAEDMFIKQVTKKGFSLVILRLNTVYGPDLRGDKLFGIISAYVKRNSWISRLNWPGRFGVVHVDDVAKEIIRFVKEVSKSGETRVYTVSTENTSLPAISRMMHRELRIPYKEIVFPWWIWKMIALSRYATFLSEKIFPSWLYNFLWRLTLITNDVLMADGTALKKLHPQLKRKKLRDHIKETIL